MTVSLTLVTVLEHHRLKDFSEIQLVLFSIIEMTMGAAVLLFGKEFFISYSNAIDNITETERKIGIINGIHALTQERTTPSAPKTTTKPSSRPVWNTSSWKTSLTPRTGWTCRKSIEYGG